MELKVGMHAVGTDGPCGEVADVVIDPAKWSVTHLVVQPHHQHDKSRLIPIDAVVSNDADHVVLSWTAQQVEDAPSVEETDFVSYDNSPPIEIGWGIGAGRVLAWPYYPYDAVGMSGSGYPYRYGPGYKSGEPALVTTTYDRVPQGTIEIRRSSAVRSSDGHTVGHVDGFLIDPTSKITHLVLDHGHLWGHRDVTIPIADVEGASSDSVRLSVTRDVIGEYPSVPFHRHGHAA